MADLLPRRRREPGLCGRRAALGILCGAAASLGLDRGHAGAPAAGIVVRLVDHDGLMAEVAAHRGKVVVLDCWSTSCPPCVREFPNLVKLAAAHSPGVVCLSLAFEYEGIGAAEDSLPTVAAFLEQVGAHGVINMASREDADAMYRKLELASVPAVAVWRADGSLAVRYDDDFAARTLGRPFTYADVEATVRDLLAEADR
ncbi:MAG: TlpA family protein disulfide reductase [Pirellulales bacterium]